MMTLLRRSTTRLAAATLALAGAGAALAPGGCAAGRTGSTSYERDYRAGRFASSYAAAKARAGDPARAGSEERAALVAGLSAHALGEHVEAERWLSRLRGSRAPEIAGKALATLGLIADERGDYERAAALLSDAATKLDGDDAAHAAFHAGEAYAAAGRIDAARVQYSAAFASADDPGLRRQATDRLNRSAFTLQLGAFSTRVNAEQAVREFTPITVGIGLGEPRVVRAQRSSGRILYLVQVGRFQDRDEAAVARQRLGGEAIIAAAPAGD